MRSTTPILDKAAAEDTLQGVQFQVPMSGYAPNPARSEAELLRMLVDKVSAMLAYWDSSLRCRFANRAYERWFGRSPESLLGKHISELLGPLYPLNLPYIEGALRGEAQEFEREIPDPSGGPPRHSIANYIPDIVEGVVQGFFVLVTDVSRIKHTEMELRESEERFRLTFDEAPIGMALVALDGRFARVNRALCEIVGYSVEELTGLTFQAITHPEDLETDLALAGRLARGEIPRYQLAKRYLRKDGTTVHIMLSGSILRSRDGTPRYYIAQIEDITERKRFEDERRIFTSLLQNSPDFIGIADPGGKAIYVNPAGRRMVGLAADYPVEQTQIADYYPAEERPFAENVIVKSMLERGQFCGETYFRHWQTEEKIPVSDTHFLILEPVTGRLLGMGTVTRDISELKRARDALKQSEERLELALKGADLGAWDWNIQTGKVIFSLRWAAMRGFGLEEVRPHVDSWISGVHPEDWPTVQKTLTDYFEGRIPEYEVEHRALTKSGEWIWILDRGKVCARDEQGRPTRMVGVELDITKRKRTEEALRLSEAKYAGIVSVSVDAIISIDDQQRITMFNEGAVQIFGYSRAEAIGAPLDLLLPERHRALHRQYVDAFMRGTTTARRMGNPDGTIVGLRKNGEEFPASAAISKLEVGGQSVLTAAIRDITEQKRAESEQRFLAEVGSVLSGSLDYEETLARIAELAVRDVADFCIVEVIEDDKEIQQRKVVSRDPSQAWLCELLARLPLDRQRPHLTQTVLESRAGMLVQPPCEDTLALGAQSEESHRLLEALKICSMVAVPLIAHGKLLGAIAFASSTASRIYGPHDVRLAEALAQRAALSIENAQLYRAARRATQVRDDVLGIVAHDLRNPLNSIVLTTRLLRLKKAEPERQEQEPAQIIERAATRMNRLIQDLLDVTRLEAGHLTIERAQISAQQVIAEVVEAEKPLANAAAIELRLKIAPDLPEIWSDRDRLIQIFENLIGNALKFTKPGGSITIGAEAKESEVLFSLSDTGSGIAAEELPHLFERFWQGRKAQRGGAGLGLSIVKGVVEAHGGRIWVESTPSKGSSFFFTIPTVRRKEA